VYGPDIPTEADLRLLGNVEGKRVVQLGAGTGHNAVALARRGARTIVVDPSASAVGDARRRCERDEVRVEFHESDLAELAFLRADTVDAVMSAWALSGVPDLNRVFRQVHRVLKTEAALVFSVPHPAFAMVAQDGERTVVARSYFDRAPLEDDGEGGVVHHHTVNDLFTALVRANFRVDALVEPEPSPGGPRSTYWTDAFRVVPRTLVVRARKEGL
jgi:SAM-dependent methyltransferase